MIQGNWEWQTLTKAVKTPWFNHEDVWRRCIQLSSELLNIWYFRFPHIHTPWFWIQWYVSHVPNTTGVDFIVKCLLTSPSQQCKVKIFIRNKIHKKGAIYKEYKKQINVKRYEVLEVDTVEVGSLHTLRLESLTLVFQPLHKCLVDKLLSWQVVFFILCMTQVIFPTIVYRQIISLIIHCITITVSQKFTYTKLFKVYIHFKQLRKFQKMSWLQKLLIG